MIGDVRALCQIAINLVSNARKFTASGGHVILRAEVASDGGILFEVADTGIGIPEEEIARVVEPSTTSTHRWRENTKAVALAYRW